MRNLSHRFIAAATVAAALLSTLALGSVGVDAFQHAHSDALIEQQRLLDEHDRATELTADIRLATRHALAHAAAASTIPVAELTDPNTAARLASATAEATDAATEFNETFRRVSGIVQTVTAPHDGDTLWPPRVTERLARVNVNLDAGDISVALAELDVASTAVIADHAEWNRRVAEAARAAAAAAAAEAARATSSSGSSRSETSGVAADPAVAAEPATIGVEQSIESYVHQYAATAQIRWVPNFCAPTIICGVTTLGGEPPVITLDPLLGSQYLSYSGKYVLVHEAAHARSWYRYHSVEILKQVSTSLMTNGLSGIPAVEWMADCATIVRLGYSLGTYTASCTPAQLAEAATYW